jgi:hypothetical protein
MPVPSPRASSIATRRGESWSLLPQRPLRVLRHAVLAGRDYLYRGVVALEVLQRRWPGPNDGRRMSHHEPTRMTTRCAETPLSSMCRSLGTSKSNATLLTRPAEEIASQSDIHLAKSSLSLRAAGPFERHDASTAVSYRSGLVFRLPPGRALAETWSALLAFVSFTGLFWKCSRIGAHLSLCLPLARTLTA